MADVGEAGFFLLFFGSGYQLWGMGRNEIGFVLVSCVQYKLAPGC